jgi:hypothetical protein
VSAYSENSPRTAHTLIRGTHEKSCDYTVTTVTLMGLKTEEHKFFETEALGYAAFTKATAD